MFDEAKLMAHITEVTGYPCEYLTEDKPSLLASGSLPKVFVDTTKIQKTDGFGSGRSTTNDQMFAEDFVQIVAVQWCSTVQDKHLVWKTLGSAIAGWNNDPFESVFTGLRYVEGGIIGRENGRVWWVDYWEIDFPRTFL